MANLYAHAHPQLILDYTCVNCQTVNHVELNLQDVGAIVTPNTFKHPTVNLVLQKKLCEHCGLANNINIATL